MHNKKAVKLTLPFIDFSKAFDTVTHDDLLSTQALRQNYAMDL